MHVTNMSLFGAWETQSLMTLQWEGGEINLHVNHSLHSIASQVTLSLELHTLQEGIEKTFQVGS